MLVAVLLAAAAKDDDHDDDDEVVANSDADDVAEEHAPVNDSMDSLCARLNNLVMKDDVSRATILIPDYCFHFVSCNCSLTVRAVYICPLPLSSLASDHVHSRFSNGDAS
jgi:hypothetical protein